MFIAVGRVVLQIQEGGSLKDKRQVVRKVTDRLRARFNVSVAEVGEQDRWQRAVLGLSVVAEERRHADAQLEKILHAIDEMYLAPMVSRQTEILSLGERLYTTVPAGSDEDGEGLDLSDGDFDLAAHLARGDRSMAEAEGLGRWEDRGRGEAEAPRSREEALRARARALRNPREWEKS